jgi:hypothetical protein
MHINLKNIEELFKDVNIDEVDEATCLALRDLYAELAKMLEGME